MSLFKGNGNIFLPGFIDYQLDSVAEIISTTQCIRKIIKKEYSKLSNFYKENPDILYSSLEETISNLDEKSKTTELTDFEVMSLEEAMNILKEKRPIEELFAFQDDFLLDSYEKIFRQITKKSLASLKKSTTVDIIYYGLTYKDENVGVGEYYSDGTINTNSQISLKLLRVNHKEFLTKYQILCN